MNRKRHWLEEIPVIMISSEDADIVISEVPMRCGVSDYIRQSV